MKVEELKKVSLGHYPTPIEKLENITKLLGKGDIYIKRDDTTGPAFGGNKTRKLEYLMKDALDQGATAVITYGGTQTNHGRTTVGAAVKLGMKPILILGGGDTGYLSGNLNLDAMMGTDIYFCKEKTPAEVTEEVVAKYEAQGDKVYIVPVGGSNTIGAVGYIMAVKEIVEQMKEQNLKIDHLVVTVGSMGTYAGTILGAKYFNAPFDVIAVPVAPQPKGEKEQQVVDFANEISAAYDMGVTVTLDDVKIAYGPDDCPYSGEAYNKPDETTREYIIMMAKNEGIFLDPTYTGKTFRGLVDMVRNEQYIKAGESVMFVHTGGAMALWTKEHLDDMQAQLRANCQTTEE